MTDESRAPEQAEPSDRVITEHGILTWGPGVQVVPKDEELYHRNAGYTQT